MSSDKKSYFKQVVKEPYKQGQKVADIIRTLDNPTRILIVFWHGLGDTLMFVELYHHFLSLFPQHTFDLSLLPGVGQTELVRGSLELQEKDFVVNHDVAFVISFPMSEGSKVTKTELCCVKELGIEPVAAALPVLPIRKPKLVAVHFQGTCLPESTNPSPELAHQIWNDIIGAGFVPIDVHFKHAFHNPLNTDLPWASRNCRDLAPSTDTLAAILSSCCAFVGVASGPFVLAASMYRHQTIYLQKHHHVSCYIKDFENVVDIINYDSQKFVEMLGGIANV